MAAETEEKKVDFDSFLEFPVRTFRFFFYNFQPLSENANLAEKVKHFVMENYFRLMLICLSMSMAMFAMFGVTHYQTNFLDSLSSVPNSNCILLIFLKGLYTFRNRREIWNIWQQLKLLVNQRIAESGFYDMKPYLDEYLLIIRIYTIPFILVVLPISYPILPYVLFGRMELVIKYWYPINIFRMEVFPFAWFWVNYVAYNASVLLMAADSLLYALITVILMEFDQLKNDLDDLKQAQGVEKIKKIELFSSRHNKLLDLVDKLQNIYDFTFLVSFVISALILCFIAFQMSVFESDFEAYAFNVPYFFMMGGQIFVLCIYGQKLIDSNLAVGHGIYDSGWEDIEDIKLKKLLVIILLRSQKPKRFTAMNFADMDLPKFTSVS